MTKEELAAMRERTKAVQKLMDLDNLDITDVDLQEVAQLEKQAQKSPVEQLRDLAKDDTPYKLDKMQQHLEAIRCVKSVRGMIFIGVDHYNSRKAATERAIRTLGLNVSPEKLKEYVDEHAYKDTLMSVKKFVTRLRGLATAVAMFPELFGEGRGGGEVREFLQESIAAINEAREFWRTFKNGDMLKNKAFRDEVTAPDFSTSDTADIKNYLGDDYKLIAKDDGKLSAGLKFAGLKKD